MGVHLLNFRARDLPSEFSSSISRSSAARGIHLLDFEEQCRA